MNIPFVREFSGKAYFCFTYPGPFADKAKALKFARKRRHKGVSTRLVSVVNPDNGRKAFLIYEEHAA